MRFRSGQVATAAQRQQLQPIFDSRCNAQIWIGSDQAGVDQAFQP